MEFTTNDSNITKDRHYVAWKEKAKAAKQEAEAVKEENSALKRERTKTVEHVHSLKKKVEELESVKNTEITAYESQIENAKLQIDKFKRKHEESERIRKDSISTLHENLFSKLLEAEAEQEEHRGSTATKSRAANHDERDGNTESGDCHHFGELIANTAVQCGCTLKAESSTSVTSRRVGVENDGAKYYSVIYPLHGVISKMTAYYY